MTYTDTLDLARTRGGHTDAEWNALKREFRFHCVRCLKRFRSFELTRDHIAPISLGGTDTIANIQPMCGPCNGRKGQKVKDYRPAALKRLAARRRANYIAVT
jgi:5-methylcytosine-specific restriction endonuclease McrA